MKSQRANVHEGWVRVKVTKTDLDNSMKAERYDVNKKTTTEISLQRILSIPYIVYSLFLSSLLSSVHPTLSRSTSVLFLPISLSLSLYLYLYLSLSLSWDGGQVHAQMQACRRSKFAINDGSYPPGSPSRRAPLRSRHQLPLLLP